MKVFLSRSPYRKQKQHCIQSSFHLIRHCKDIKKIMYIYPFNTLIDQNLKLIEGIFENDTDVLSNITVVNSVTPILKEEIKTTVTQNTKRPC